MIELGRFLGRILGNNGRHVPFFINSNHKALMGHPPQPLVFSSSALNGTDSCFALLSHRALDGRHDLEAIDLALIQSLISIRDIHNGGLLTEETFRDMGLGGFEVVTADGRRVDLPTPGGASREVTQDNRLEFADMVEAFKMREYRVPVRTPIIFCLGYTKQ